MFPYKITELFQQSGFLSGFRKSPEIRHFLTLIYLSLTSILPSPHGSRQWLKCPQYTGINQTGMFEGTNQVYAVTAGATVSAAFAGVHRNHHFDTIERLHPLLHPPKNKEMRSLHPGIGSGYSSFYGKMQSSLFFYEKRDINEPRVNISFFLL